MLTYVQADQTLSGFADDELFLSRSLRIVEYGLDNVD